MKKVLIITYYWPPSGGGGVQRWLKFAKYLPQYGITPIMVVPENPEYPVIDKSLEKDIPPEAEIIKIPIWEPYTLFKILTGKKKTEKVNSGVLSKSQKKSLIEKLSIWIRGNLLIPDPRVFWVKPATKRLFDYLQSSDIKTIITTGPPHSVHLIGLKLKKKLDIKWIADFRDPWSEIDYLDEFNLGKRAMTKQKRLEKQVLTTADKIITVSSNWANDLERLGVNKVEVITNGYDEDDFKDIEPCRFKDKFILLYSGILHDYRNPEYLWNELEKLCERDSNIADKFELKLFGTIDGNVINYINNLPFLSKRYYYGGYISHSELLNEYSKASALLLLQNNTKNAMGHIPGKLFEYLASGKPILALGPDGESDVKKIMDETQSGKVLNNNSIKLLKDVLNTSFNDAISDNIEKYSRKELTNDIVKIIQNA